MRTLTETLSLTKRQNESQWSVLLHTVSSLQMNLKVENFERSKCGFTYLITYVSSYVWCTLWCTCIIYKWLCICVQYKLCRVTQTAYWLRPDGTGGPEKGQRETRGRRSNWRPKRFIMQERAWGFSLSEEALVVSEARDLNGEQYTKVAAAVPRMLPDAAMKSMKRKDELWPRHHCTVSSRG